MSRYLPKKRTLFLHLPRTGGTWIERAIGKMRVSQARWTWSHDRTLPSKHLFLLNYHRSVVIQPRFLFTVVRHPVDYYPAIWRWLKTISEKTNKKIRRLRRGRYARWTWHPQQRAAELYSPDFDVWTERMLEDQGAWIGRDYSMMIGPEGAEWIHYVGRTETLVDDFFSVMDLIGYRDRADKARDKIAEIGIVNQMKRDDWEWRADLLAQVKREERVAIRRWWSKDAAKQRWYGELDRHGIEAVMNRR